LLDRKAVPNVETGINLFNKYIDTHSRRLFITKSKLTFSEKLVSFKKFDDSVTKCFFKQFRQWHIASIPVCLIQLKKKYLGAYIKVVH